MVTKSEIYRVLKPEGRYITAEFTRFTPENLLVTHILERMETARGVTVISAEKSMGVV